MTILEFARLCGTTTQTLRYYDRVNLLNPCRVDAWTGYRYYEKEQATDFVKIKNLQLADFSLAEIKALLSASEEAIYRAFDEKIAAEQKKLEKILKIQESYRKETMTIDSKINAIAAFLRDELSSAELKQRFPELDPEEIRQWKNNMKAFCPEDYALMQEWKAFDSFQNVAAQLPVLERSRDYALIAGTADAADKNKLVQMLMTAAAARLATDGPQRKSGISVFLVDAPEGRPILKLLRSKEALDYTELP